MTMIPSGLDKDHPPMSIGEAIEVLLLHNPLTIVANCYDGDGVATTAIQTCVPDLNYEDWASRTVADVVRHGKKLQMAALRRRQDQWSKEGLQLIEDLRGIVG